MLVTLPSSPDTQSMWSTLSKLALKDGKLKVAERCFAAVGDVATSRYLKTLNENVKSIDSQGFQSGVDHYSVRAKLALLDKQFKLAENIYIEQGRVDEAMSMYQEMHKWDMAVKVAEMKAHPELETLKRNYYSWLVDSGQEDQAAELKEDEGEFVEAIQLYLKAGMPGKASSLLLSRNQTSNKDLTERVAAALYKSALYEKAGQLYETLSQNDRAFESYKKGRAFRAAIELARSSYPAQVVTLEEVRMITD